MGSLTTPNSHDLESPKGGTSNTSNLYE